MKVLNVLLVSIIALFAALASGSALAHGHARVGVVVGVPAWGWGGPWWGYPYPGFYGYAPYHAPFAYPTGSPPVYVEQGEGSQPSQEQPSPAWFYCPDSKAYYPYVKECPAGWQRVAPQSPPS